MLELAWQVGAIHIVGEQLQKEEGKGGSFLVVGGWHQGVTVFRERTP